MARKPKNEKPMSGAERVRNHRNGRSTIHPDEIPAVIKKQRKLKSDTDAALVKSLQNVAKGPLMPPHMVRLSEHAMLYWHGIVESRAREDWTNVDLVTAAQLAKYQAQLAEEEILIETEERVVFDYLGKQQINPRFLVAETLVKRVMALMRALRMGGKAAGELNGLANNRVLEGKSRQIHAEIEDSDGLLA